MKSFREVIENQLNDKDPISTYETYQMLLDKGFDEERVIQKLMVYIEEEIYDTYQITMNLMKMNGIRK